MAEAKFGIIGGSGLYQMAGLEDIKEVRVETPFGPPSDACIIGTLSGVRVAFLARHSQGHKLLPTELPFRANIFAMKKLGVERILSASAVGSLKAEHKPIDIVLPDQFIDRTRARQAESTFFGEGLVAHVSFAEPICHDLADAVEQAARNLGGVELHRGGTYICMEGPAFSTKAESNLYRSWGADLIGMTNLQEAKLAKEAEMCYVSIALVTDYDCWHPEHDSVTVDMVMHNLLKNSENAQRLIKESILLLASRQASCKCASALEHALQTDRALVPSAVRKKLAPIIGKYFAV